MNRRPFAKCLWLSTLLLPLPLSAQQQDPQVVTNNLSVGLLIRGGVHDVTVNRSMIEAFLGAGDLAAIVRQGHESLVRECSLGNTWSGGSHGDGVRQLEFSVQVATNGEPSREQVAGMRVALAAAVRHWLSGLLYEQPRRELEEEAETLLQQLQVLAQEQAAPHGGGDMAASVAALQQRRAQLDAQRMEVRLLLATETEVREHLRELRARYDAQQAQLEDRRRDIVEGTGLIAQEVDRLKVRIRDLTRVGDPQQELQGLIARVDELEGARVQLHREGEDAVRALGELSKVMSFALEQLPATELLLVRTRARRSSLDEEQLRLEAAEAELQQRRQDEARRAVEHEIREVQLGVVKQQLAEVRGKLARLRPVRVDLLGGH